MVSKNITKNSALRRCLSNKFLSDFVNRRSVSKTSPVSGFPLESALDMITPFVLKSLEESLNFTRKIMM
jgi:hypothetical protein